MRKASSELVFSTGDDSKVRLVKAALSDLPIQVIQKDLEIAEVQSLDPAVVAVAKAGSAFGILRRPVIVEDSSLEIEELDGFPGALVKPVLDRVKAEGICRFADLTRHRRCRMTRTIAHADARGHITTFTSRGEGWRIAARPCDPGGDGSTFQELARVLIPEGFDRPFALFGREAVAGLHASSTGTLCYDELARWLRDRPSG